MVQVKMKWMPLNQAIMKKYILNLLRITNTMNNNYKTNYLLNPLHYQLQLRLLSIMAFIRIKKYSFSASDIVQTFYLSICVNNSNKIPHILCFSIHIAKHYQNTIYFINYPAFILYDYNILFKILSRFKIIRYKSGIITPLKRHANHQLEL